MQDRIDVWFVVHIMSDICMQHCACNGCKLLCTYSGWLVKDLQANPATWLPTFSMYNKTGCAQAGLTGHAHVVTLSQPSLTSLRQKVTTSQNLGSMV